MCRFEDMKMGRCEDMEIFKSPSPLERAGVRLNE
jgi:hypothetical protein